MGSQLKIYTIYTAKDREAMRPILDDLKALAKEHNLSIRHENPILEGQQWQPYSESFLEETDIFLLLLSTTFMYSEFVKQLEFKLLIDSYKAGDSRVIPILLEDCPWDTEFLSEDYKFSFKELAVLPEQQKPIKKWSTTAEAYTNIAASIEKIVSNRKAITIQPVEEVFQEVEEIQENKKEEVIPNGDAEAKQQRIEEENLKERAEELKTVENEKKLAGMLAAQKKAEDERKRLEQAEVDSVLAFEGKKQKEQENTKKIAVTTTSKNEATTGLRNDTSSKKRILVGVLIAVLAIIGIWVFSGSNESQEKPVSNVKNTPNVDVQKSKPVEEVKIVPVQKEISGPIRAIGDYFEGGIIFSVDTANKTGILVHIDDAGPMPWQSAIKIHEALGTGWRLPTFEELKLMRNSVGQGADNKAEFSNGLYWSATAYGEHQAQLLRFRDANTSYHYNRNIDSRSYKVRAIRDFSW